MQLRGIEIKNFKNVKHGKIAIPEKMEGEGASILGIYGQNGTGKTAVVDALMAFRGLVQGEPIPERYAGYVQKGTDAFFAFSFDAKSKDRKRNFTIRYELVFHAQRDEPEPFSLNPKMYPTFRPAIISERLRYSSTDEDGNGIRMHDAAASSNKKGVWPKRFVESLAACKSGPGYKPQIEELTQSLEDVKLTYSRVLAHFDKTDAPKDNPDRTKSLNSISSIIPELQDTITLCEAVDEKLRNATITDFSTCHKEGKSYLFQESISQLFTQDFSTNDDLTAIYKEIVGQEIAISGLVDEGQLSFNRLPIFTLRNPLNSARLRKLNGLDSQPSNEEIRIDNGLSPNITDLQVDPYETNWIDEAKAENVKKTLPYLNIILESIIPGLNIEMPAGEPDEDGIADMQWYSVRKSSDGESYRIPLANESHGIQRIVGWAMLLVYVYNERDFIAVIDEIDAGIFEYLLGEILNIIESEGRGQLIFTSHNLRPLEMLDKSSVVFTTINPENRYTRLKNVKPTNNLRDMYFRAITLDTQDETLYDYVSRGRLGSAFSRAYLDPIEERNDRLINAIISQSEKDGAPLSDSNYEELRSILDSRSSEEGNAHGE